MADQLLYMLQKAYFSNELLCGPGKQYRAYFNSKTDVDLLKENISYVVPDNSFRPEIYISIDFLHQFTVDTGDGTLSQPVVSTEVFNTFYTRIRQFASYYFKYYGSIRSNNINTNLFSEFLLKQPADPAEYDKNLFINYFINYFLTEISVTRGRTAIGEATITLRDNAVPLETYPNLKNTLFTDCFNSVFNQLFMPMLPVMIWAKGRFYKDFYFPLFSGYIVGTSSQNSEGFTSLVISCKDYLELARVTFTTVAPALLMDYYPDKSNFINIFDQPLFGFDHMEIFHKLIHGGRLYYNKDKQLANIDDSNITEGESGGNVPSGIFLTKLLDFEKVTQTTKKRPYDVYDAKGVHKDDFSMIYALNQTQHSRKRATVSWGYTMNPYRVFGTRSTQLFTSDISSRLELLRESANIVYFEMYVDAWGNIQYHPMRLANKYLEYDIIAPGDVGNHQMAFPSVQCIGNTELISSVKNFNIDDLVTTLTFIGNPGFNTNLPAAMGLVGTYKDEVLAAKFGNRYESYTHPCFSRNDSVGGRKLFDAVAESYVRFKNAELYSGEFNIIFRPELEIAMPIYLFPTNEIFYINSISHNVVIGSSANTVISCSFGRNALDPVPEFLNYVIDAGKVKNLTGEKFTEGNSPMKMFKDAITAVGDFFGLPKDMDDARRKSMLRNEQMAKEQLQKKTEYQNFIGPRQEEDLSLAVMTNKDNAQKNKQITEMQIGPIREE